MAEPSMYEPSIRSHRIYVVPDDHFLRKYKDIDDYNWIDIVRYRRTNYWFVTDAHCDFIQVIKGQWSFTSKYSLDGEMELGVHYFVLGGAIKWAQRVAQEMLDSLEERYKSDN